MADITNINESWDKHTGAEVEALIKSQIVKALQSGEIKFGGVSYEGGKLSFYDDENRTTLLGAVTLSGDSYLINQGADCSTSFYCLVGDTEKLIGFTPTTQVMSFVNPVPGDYTEDYVISIAVDNGSGQFVDKPLPATYIKSGTTFSMNVRPFLVMGANRIRITIRGLESNQAKTVVYTCVVTSLTLTSRFSWHNAWVEGKEIAVNGLYFSGNMQKTLHVKVDETEYTKDFASGQSYSTTEFVFRDIAFPGDTGIHAVEIWLDGEGVETPHYNYHVMCVREADLMTANLVCINDIMPQVNNYEMANSLFMYATFGATELQITASACDGENEYNLKSETQKGLQTQYPYRYPLSLEIETEAKEGISVTVDVSSSGNTESAKIDVSNKNAYIATEGADIYIKASENSNTSDDREFLLNSAKGATQKKIPAQYADMSWSVNDGYTLDSDGNSCLRINAGSTVKVASIKPFTDTIGKNKSVEFMFRIKNIADYDTPIMTVMDTSTYNPSRTVGMMVFPTKILLLTESERSIDYQHVNFSEDAIIHVVTVFQINYNGLGRNLCSVYVNGVQNLAFEYSNGFGEGQLVIGQPSSDFELYMYRSYNKALEAHNVKDNFLNALIETATINRASLREANAILDGNSISYDLVKSKGYNCLVVETDERIPDLENNTAGLPSVNIRLEYWKTPEKNIKITNIPIDGQGTTSKKYFRWNLRNKIKNPNPSTGQSVQWIYNYGSASEYFELGKEGYINGYNAHPKVSKITHKKNTASSMQGHKMGATAFYNDVWQSIFGDKHIIPDGARVSVYQEPMIGFQMFSDGTYEFIGLYTSGPDKTDSKTFGYNTDEAMMIEGPNHAPYATRFLVPWIDVKYSSDNETLEFGGEEGWDADVAGGYSTDKSSDNAAIMKMYEDNFKQSYEHVYFNSPFIMSLSEAGFDNIDTLNSQKATFREGTTKGLKNDIYSLYDSSYNLIYWSIKDKKYKVHPSNNVKTWLIGYLSASAPTTDQIIEARHRKFLAEMENNGISLQEARYHICFCILIGATDNFAKNSYWRKLLGGLWGFNQDDLDTIFDRDNNGQGTKSPYIEYNDRKGTDEIFQGSTSAFWYHLDMCDQEGIGEMMGAVIEAIVGIGKKLGITGNTREIVFEVFRHYFWSKSSEYFPLNAYNADTKYTYIDIWAKNPTKTYNGVAPLTQAGGDQLEGEKWWVERRIDYIMSKYHIGAFTGSDSGGLGTLEFTPARKYTFEVTPASPIYPTISIGGASSTQGERTGAGEICELVAESDGATTCYLKALDMMSSIGDLHKLELSSRGGADSIVFSVSGKRLRELVVGSTDSADVNFNATSLNVQGEAIEVIDARNVYSLRGNVDLSKCPRLKKAMFEGTNVNFVMVPVGSKLSELSLPDSTNALFMHSLAKLRLQNIFLNDYSNIVQLYVNNCDYINPLELLENIYALQGSKLRFATVRWNGTISGTAETLSFIAELAKLGRVIYNEEQGTITADSEHAAQVEGAISVESYVYRDDIEQIKKVFNNLIITGVIGYYIKFKDPEIQRILLASTSINPNQDYGITETEARNVTSFPSFSGNDLITEFSEIPDFPNAKLANNQFYNCSNLVKVDVSNLELIPANAFNGCVSLQSVLGSSKTITIQNKAFCNCGKISHLDLSSIETIGDEAFYACAMLSISGLSKLKSVGSRTFYGCTSLNSILNMDNLTTIGSEGFRKSSIVRVSAPNCETVGTKAFMECASLSEVNLNAIEMISDYMFDSCVSLKHLDLLDRVTSIGNYSLQKSGLEGKIIIKRCKTIGSFAFADCTNVSGIILEDIESIGQRAFTRIPNLQYVICNNTIVPQISSSAFSETNNVFAIYVPDESVNDYKSATNWSSHASKIKPISTFQGEF